MTSPLSYRKIGGLHWLCIGRIRIAWCLCAKRKPDPIITRYARGKRSLTVQSDCGPITAYGALAERIVFRSASR